jgi:hypothetical protein
MEDNRHLREKVRISKKIASQIGKWDDSYDLGEEWKLKRAKLDVWNFFSLSKVEKC